MNALFSFFAAVGFLLFVLYITPYILFSVILGTLTLTFAYTLLLIFSVCSFAICVDSTAKGISNV